VTEPVASRAPDLGSVDAKRSWAEAVAIRDGRIVFVGSNEDAKTHIGPETKVVELDGRLVLPGFQDSHVHPISAGIEASSCDLNGLTTVDEYVAAIKKYAAANPDEPWISGGGWLMSAFGPGALARRELIDAVVPDRPVFSGADGHTVCQHRALEIAGSRTRRRTRRRPHRPRSEDRHGGRQPPGGCG
jgi:predicted amidohydrolase YtcJ